MEVYKNPNCRKIKGSHLLKISCAYCKQYIALYQKVGRSNLVKMYNDRIVEGTINFEDYHGSIICPSCNKQIATRYITKFDKKEAYRFIPSTFNKKQV